MLEDELIKKILVTEITTSKSINRHQCSKGFWSWLFSSFCLGFRPDEYWDETKRISCKGTRAIERFFCFGYMRTEAIFTHPTIIFTHPIIIFTHQLQSCFQPPRHQLETDTQNSSVAGAQSTTKSPFMHLKMQQQHLHRDAPATAHHRAVRHRATMLHCTCHGAPHHDSHRIRTSSNHYLHHVRNNNVTHTLTITASLHT